MLRVKKYEEFSPTTEGELTTERLLVMLAGVVTV